MPIKNINLNYLTENKPNFIVVFLIIIFVFVLVNTTSPNNFAEGKLVTINKGQTIRETATLLKKENIIRSEIAFNSIIVLKEGNVIEGTYLFHKSQNIFKVIDKVMSGTYDIPIQKITFFEGETSYRMAQKLKNAIPNFDVNTFYKLAKEKEGYLFPDTYEFSVVTSAENIIKVLEENFNQKIATIKENIENSGRTLEEVVKMASVIEGEADGRSMQDVSNILWKRYDLEMPLQVDATFVYSIGKNTFELTMSDLRDEQNPYNSYVFTGLPPTPISNPGLSALKAATNQQSTPYLFFLTGRDGNMYYASNFEEHKNNRFLYLD